MTNKINREVGEKLFQWIWNKLSLTRTFDEPIEIQSIRLKASRDSWETSRISISQNNEVIIEKHAQLERDLKMNVIAKRWWNGLRADGNLNDNDSLNYASRCMQLEWMKISNANSI